jgi:putative transposase
VLLKREGYLVNHKKLFRLYREEKLAVRRRGGRKQAIGTRAPMTVPMAPNDRWSLDFVSDQLTDGHRFRILTVVDDCTRECLALVADTSLSGTRVARELDRLMIERGKPKIMSAGGSAPAPPYQDRLPGISIDALSLADRQKSQIPGQSGSR